jgi:hypothetical protein
MRENIPMRSNALATRQVRLHLVPPPLVRLTSWREGLERVRATLGRAQTIDVTDGEWLEHWRAGLDPVDAVLAELRD